MKIPIKWKDVTALVGAAPALLHAAEAITKTAYSAEETGHSEAMCIAQNWDYLGPLLQSAIAQARPEITCRARAAATALLEQLQAVLIRLDLEPSEAVFPCSAMRESIRRTIAQARSILDGPP